MTEGRLPGLILAGGRSSRMGANKALLALGSDTILGHVVRRLSPQVQPLWLNAAADLARMFALPAVPDTIADHAGPLAGVLAGLRALADADATHLLTAPCDSPFLPRDLAERLQAACDSPSSIVVASSAGRDHLVFGLWPFSLADDLEAWLSDANNRRLNAFLRRHQVVTVDFPLVETSNGLLDPFLNLNTPEDLAEARNFVGLLA
ncbi:molybdenum cofactor guanylyltransferase MobA [Neorhizobium lilium]|uniref:Molybdenum cofactor guanylyltransferase n=1 Tax=Neorhizobium lilium TaxID=2503024 RepID=A0A444LCU9_9HYPH|nr:molybdenum cofactor guanylyltransferase MobA [Neorhizobium lilium]RWX75524.1 molybdenum cofactor guanylyltransferase MobA [Neorhizobium lilium]